jgi:hypothetical protein
MAETRRGRETDWKLLMFDSNWTKESKGGSGEFFTAFGYILFNDDKSKMMFIHVGGNKYLSFMSSGFPAFLLES